jgi:hypothetical protein
MFIALFVLWMALSVPGGGVAAQRVVAIPPAGDVHWEGHEYPTSHRNHGVRVPFYLYSGGGFDAFTASCKRRQWSKGVEVSWLNRLEVHPWRVR